MKEFSFSIKSLLLFFVLIGVAIILTPFKIVKRIVSLPGEWGASFLKALGNNG